MERHPIFPLNLFLLPGETTYLHIFEPRYKQLLEDAETEGIPFGVYFHGKENRSNLGTMVELEEVINRYQNGELDISVKATRMFRLEWFFETLNDKLYPGGEIRWYDLEDRSVPSEIITEYGRLINMQNPGEIMELPAKIYAIASTLNMSSKEKLSFVQMEEVNQDRTLMSHIKLHSAIAQQESNDQFNFNLN